MTRTAIATPAVLAALLTLAACGESAPSVDEAVRSYTSAYLSGDGGTAYSLLSTRCKATISPDVLQRQASAAAALYGQARIVSLEPSVDGDRAKVTYRFDQPAIDQQNQPWVLEDAVWRYDQC